MGQPGDDNCLTVACAADRASYRAPVPADVVEILPVAGRRLHAKYLILQYDADPGLGLARTSTRVIVTSANLTRRRSHAATVRSGRCTRSRRATPASHRSPATCSDATEAMARELPAGAARRRSWRRTGELRATPATTQHERGRSATRSPPGRKAVSWPDYLGRGASSSSVRRSPRGARARPCRRSRRSCTRSSAWTSTSAPTSARRCCVKGRRCRSCPRWQRSSRSVACSGSTPSPV